MYTQVVVAEAAVAGDDTVRLGRLLRVLRQNSDLLWGVFATSRPR